ncbi:MAG: RNA polymerase sigma factor [Thermoleophilaceae bacterium]
MSACGLTVGAPTDAALVAGVRAGQDSAFEELYRRYRPRIHAFVRRFVRDDGRAEDVTQDAFLSALRRLRATDSDIAFKPWIYEIARNAAIDAHRRSRRAEEVSMEAVELMAPSDRLRLLGTGAAESRAAARERLEYLRGAFDELSETHHRVLVMREFEGRSYREIAERLDLTRPAVESTLFRARRRLEHMYSELETGRRCDSVRAAIGRLAEGMDGAQDTRRLARHARRCSACRRRARELGVEPLGRFESARAKAAALLPLPALARSLRGTGRAASSEPLGPMAASSGQAAAAFAERAAALLAAAALASAGSAILNDSVDPARPAPRPASAPPDGLVNPRPVFPAAQARPDPANRPAPRGSRAHAAPAAGEADSAAGPSPAGGSTAGGAPGSLSQPSTPVSKPAERVLHNARAEVDAVTKTISSGSSSLPSTETVLTAAKGPLALVGTIRGRLLRGRKDRPSRHEKDGSS